MKLFGSISDRNATSLNVAAAREPTKYSENFAAGVGQFVDEEMLFSPLVNSVDYTERNKRVNSLIDEGVVPEEVLSIFTDDYGLNLRERDYSLIAEWLNENRLADNERISTDENMIADRNDLLKVKRDYRESVMSRATTAGQVGVFAGGITASFAAPENILTGLVTAPLNGAVSLARVVKAGKRLTRARYLAGIAKTGAILGATEAAMIEPFIHDWKEDIGAEYSIVDSLWNIGMSGLFNSALTTTASGLNSLWFAKFSKKELGDRFVMHKAMRQMGYSEEDTIAALDMVEILDEAIVNEDIVTKADTEERANSIKNTELLTIEERLESINLSEKEQIENYRKISKEKGYDLSTFSEEQISDLNRINVKIVEVVLVLNEAGIETIRSGDLYGDALVYIDLKEPIDPNIKLPKGWILTSMNSNRTNSDVLGLEFDEVFYKDETPNSKNRRIAKKTNSPIDKKEALEISKSIENSLKSSEVKLKDANARRVKRDKTRLEKSKALEKEAERKKSSLTEEEFDAREKGQSKIRQQQELNQEKRNELSLKQKEDMGEGLGKILMSLGFPKERISVAIAHLGLIDSILIRYPEADVDFVLNAYDENRVKVNFETVTKRARELRLKTGKPSKTLASKASKAVMNALFAIGKVRKAGVKDGIQVLGHLMDESARERAGIVKEARNEGPESVKFINDVFDLIRLYTEDIEFESRFLQSKRNLKLADLTRDEVKLLADQRIKQRARKKVASPPIEENTGKGLVEDMEATRAKIEQSESFDYEAELGSDDLQFDVKETEEPDMINFSDLESNDIASDPETGEPISVREYDSKRQEQIALAKSIVDCMLKKP